MRTVQRWYAESARNSLVWNFISPQQMVQLEQFCVEPLVRCKDPAKVKKGEDQKQKNQPEF